MTGRKGGTSTCKWCPRKALVRPGSAQVCAACRDRIDRVIRDSISRQRRLGLTNVDMAREFGFSLDTWRRLKIQAEHNPDEPVVTARVDPLHRELREADPAETARRWEHRAACRSDPDPDRFFPDTAEDRAAIDRVLTVCMECPVARECRAHRGRVGVWGGKLYVQL